METVPQVVEKDDESDQSIEPVSRDRDIIRSTAIAVKARSVVRAPHYWRSVEAREKACNR